jgi:hypothetical protein
MKAVGLLLLVVGLVLMVIQVVLGATSYHLSRTHDMHKFILWMGVGLALVIIGALLAKRGD